MAEFDLAKLMKDVSKMDTGRQQIRYIPLDLIDPDPANFYSLDGLEELNQNGAVGAEKFDGFELLDAMLGRR